MNTASIITSDSTTFKTSPPINIELCRSGFRRENFKSKTATRVGKIYENPPAKAERNPGNPENNAQTTEIINNTITCNGTI